MKPTPILVLTNTPDQATAERLARELVQRRLAACVNILAPCASTYRWQGAVETANEVPVFIKTLDHRYDKVEAAIRELHPYELPEIVAVPVVAALAEYAGWIADSTSA